MILARPPLRQAQRAPARRQARQVSSPAAVADGRRRAGHTPVADLSAETQPAQQRLAVDEQLSAHAGSQGQHAEIPVALGDVVMARGGEVVADEDGATGPEAPRQAAEIHPALIGRPHQRGQALDHAVVHRAWNRHGDDRRRLIAQNLRRQLGDRLLEPGHEVAGAANAFAGNARAGGQPAAAHDAGAQQGAPKVEDQNAHEIVRTTLKGRLLAGRGGERPAPRPQRRSRIQRTISSAAAVRCCGASSK